jgi:hypothetical protein
MNEPGLYDYIVVNNDLEAASKELDGIAARALMGEVGGPSTAPAAVGDAEDGVSASHEVAAHAAAEVSSSKPGLMPHVI